MRRARPVLAVLCAAPLLLAGCGGDDEEGAGALSKEDFVAQAETVCTEANTAGENVETPGSPEAVDALLDQSLQLGEDTATRLEDLADGYAEQQRVEQIFLTPLRGQVEQLREALPGIKESFRNGTQPQAPPTGPGVDEQAMRDYGFTSCLEFADSE